MTQIFDEEGNAIPVTVIQAGPCVVTQIKTVQTDGYTAIQVAYGNVAEKALNKPELGHLAKAGSTPMRHLKEYHVDSPDAFELGQAITAEQFEAGQLVDVSGTSIGKGFAGYQKRHNFSRGPMAHGSKNHRQPGSIGAGTTPGRVYPGKHMAGRLGGEKVTTRKITVVRVDSDRNLLVVKGTVPGKAGTLLSIAPANLVGKK
ncbi:50S ribosomal protein L3 [Leptolyngbya sp. PCC 6406]|uniref:50S ribosomal protein L3 n=1 Tax=Leptolyngbya sp. PCC 6406 TaxID=1173264 RepID=UPI0002AC8CBD